MHGNLEALEAVLEKSRGIDMLCLGDLVDYGADSNLVIERLRSSRVRILLGNHDRAALTGDTSMFNRLAAVSSMMTRKKLTKENMDFLGGLPEEIRLDFEGVQSYFTHGSPDDHLWEYVDVRTHHLLFGHYLQKLRVGLIGLGHTHVPYVWPDPKGIVFNPGSVGQPRDGDPRASFAILTFGTQGVSVAVNRVSYDVAAAAAKIRGAGLPESFARRLETGS